MKRVYKCIYITKQTIQSVREGRCVVARLRPGQHVHHQTLFVNHSCQVTGGGGSISYIQDEGLLKVTTPLIGSLFQLYSLSPHPICIVCILYTYILHLYQNNYFTLPINRKIGRKRRNKKISLIIFPFINNIN